MSSGVEQEALLDENTKKKLGKGVLWIGLFVAFCLTCTLVLMRYVFKPSPKSCAASYGDDPTDMQKTGKSACLSVDSTTGTKSYLDATCNHGVWVCPMNTCSMLVPPPGTCTIDQMTCSNGVSSFPTECSQPSTTT
jgi:hypothetical protein